jgi:hypothetical protein
MNLKHISLALAAAAFITPVVQAQQAPSAQQISQTQDYCYGLSVLAKMTVLERNAGKSLDEQLTRRQRSLGPDSAEYKLMEDIAKQIYSQDRKDALPVIAEVHRSCLSAKGTIQLYSPQAVRECPAVGAMVAEVSALRRRGAGAEQVKTVLGERYGNLPANQPGGFDAFVNGYSETSKPDNGSFEHTLCMIKGIVASK